MSRGNQREKAREKNQAATAGKVRSSLSNSGSQRAFRLTPITGQEDHRTYAPIPHITTSPLLTICSSRDLSRPRQKRTQQRSCATSKLLVSHLPPPTCNHPFSDIKPQPRSAKRQRPRAEARRRSRHMRYPNEF